MNLCRADAVLNYERIKFKGVAMEQLKTCPCCGADAELNFGRIARPLKNDVEVIAYVICRTCGLRTQNYHATESRYAGKQAVHAWNMREGSQ